MTRRTAGLVAAGFLTLASAAVPVHAETLEPGDPSALFTVATQVAGLAQPTGFAFLPDGRMVVTERGGAVYLVGVDGTKQVIGRFRVDIVSEMGLLNVLPHPDFSKNRLLFFYYSAADQIGGSDLDRHRVVTVKLDASDQLDLTSETIIVRGLRGPRNHDGGALALGPDGKLYIGVGDSGCNSNLGPEPPYPPTNYFGTCLTNGNGKILRVELDGTIPKDNPLVGKTVTACGATCGDDVTALPLAAAREDIWAWGFRNPWRFSFDSRTGNLWVGDVGENTYEEVDILPARAGSQHYGWPWREAAHGHTPATCQSIVPHVGDCVDPVYSCVHGPSTNANTDGNCVAVTGGVVVNSCQFPLPFRGRYFFGDSSNFWIATLDPTPEGKGVQSSHRTPFLKTVGGGPIHFGVGPDGALYYSRLAPSAGNSTIERVFPKIPSSCPPPVRDAGQRDAERRSPSGPDAAKIRDAAGRPRDASTTKRPQSQDAAPDVSLGSAPDARSLGSPPSTARADGSCSCRLGPRAGRRSLPWALLTISFLSLRARRSVSNARRSRKRATAGTSTR